MNLLAIIGARVFLAAVAGGRRRQSVDMLHDEVSVAVTYGRLGDVEVLFLSRHGLGHRLPLHRISYRASLRTQRT